MKNKIISSVLAIAMMASMATTAFADAPGPGVYESGGNESVPVTLNVAPAIFSVTVPSALPVSVTADGEVVCAASGAAKIINNSHGAVKVTNLALNGINGWESVDFDNANMHKAQVNSRLFAFTINNEKTTGADAITFDTANFPVLDGTNDTDSDELVINYDALIAPQNTAVVDTDIANVVFTIGWEEVSVPVLPEIGKTAEEYTWNEISSISNAGLAADYFDLGDTKTFVTNDNQEIVMEIVAFNADEKSNGEKVGITWISKDLVAYMGMNPTLYYEAEEFGWEHTELRAWMQSDFFDTFPSDLKDAITPVKKVYSEPISYDDIWVIDNVWVPSLYEIQGDSYCNDEFGPTYYDRFSTQESRIKSFEGEPMFWWTRSGNVSGSTGNVAFFGFGATGYQTYSSSHNGREANGVVLGFCI